MPNWVFNTLTIQGPKDQIDYIKNKLNEPFTKSHDSWDMDKGTMVNKEFEYNNPVFSFWNIIKPEDLYVYSLQSDPNADGSKWFSGNNWYDWNVRNWGTKWDVAVSDDEEYPETELIEHVSEGEDNWLIYRFDTAWSPPRPAITRLSELIPNCVLTLEYQEETGWGGEDEFVNGSVTELKDYEWICRQCQHMEDETPYCDTCEHDMCPKCGYGEPDLDLLIKCQTHAVELETTGKAE